MSRFGPNIAAASRKQHMHRSPLNMKDLVVPHRKMSCKLQHFLFRSAFDAVTQAVLVALADVLGSFVVFSAAG